MTSKPSRFKIEAEIEAYASAEDLDPTEQNLVSLASAAADRAYAPYSKYHVGAAALLENGEIVTGNNQENAAYPSGLCAERVAIFYAYAKFPGVKIRTIAIVTMGNEPAAPCGSCRQAIAEYEHLAGKGIRILMAARGGKIFASRSISDLLPLAFNRDQLG